METPSADRGRLGGKFEGFTQTPSDGLFERIATKVEERPGALGSRFDRWEHAPNSAMWGRIKREIQPWHTRRLWWASAIAGLILLGSLTAAQWLPESQENTGFKPMLASTTPAPAPGFLSQPRSRGAETTSCGDSLFLHANGFFGYSGNLFALLTQFPQNQMPFCGGTNAYSFPGWMPVVFLPGADSAHVHPAPVEAIVDSTIPKAIPVEEYFPEIELPKGSEAEGTMGFRLGTNLSQGGVIPVQKGNLAQADNWLESSSFSLAGSAAADYTLAEREEFSMPFVVGFTVDLPLTERLHLLPGVHYTNMRSTLGEYMEYQAARHYLGLSVSGSYDVVQGKRSAVYVLMGVQGDAGLGVDLNRGEIDVATTEPDLKAGNQLSVIAGAGVSHMITAHLGVFAQAQVNTYLLQSHANVWSQKPLWPTAQVGLKVQM